MTYVVFGWTISESMNPWTVQLIRQAQIWGLLISPITAQYIIYFFITLIILCTILLITMPLKLLNAFFGTWLASNIKTFISILFWSFVLVVVLHRFPQIVKILLVWSASILGKLELQKFDYKNSKILAILFSTSLLGFVTGCLAFIFWS